MPIRRLFLNYYNGAKGIIKTVKRKQFGESGGRDNNDCFKKQFGASGDLKDFQDFSEVFEINAQGLLKRI